MRVCKIFMIRSVTSHLIFVLLFTGCMNMRIVAQYDSANPVPEKETRWSWFWGLKQPNDIKTDDLCSSVCMVTIKNNFGYALISALSLGIAVPMTVEYNCCPHEPEPGEF